MLIAELPSEPPCVNLIIQGRLLTQVSDEPRMIDPNVIVMRWTWRLTLRVDNVVAGRFQGRTIDAVGVQHSAIGRDYGRTFFLGQRGDEYRLIAIAPTRLSSRNDLADWMQRARTQLCVAQSGPETG